MIVVDDLHKHFGGFHAVDGASLTINQGTITGLIGPNGAGKTTLFNVIAGVLKPTSGRVTMNGRDITGLEPHELFHKGLLRTFQIAHEFSSMTCRENLMMVPAGQSGETLWNTWFGRKRIANEERALAAKAPQDREVLLFVHGYNNNFAEGVYRVAQFSHDLEIPGAVVHYAWPSAAKPLGYVYDRDSALFARDGLERLIDDFDAANIFDVHIAFPAGNHEPQRVALLGAQHLFSEQAHALCISAR